MKNILKIASSDIRRLGTNVVAVVMIMGLSVLPCLYAWFNILSNWDPYGEESTCNLTVAVASEDLGVTFSGASLNVGDTIVENLKQNTTIGWVFCDTAEEAVNGVYAGDYYAALVIDADFSENMISFLGGDVEHPVIHYYENEKKNAIAPKITGKVKTTVQQEVDTTFVSTIAEVLLKAGDTLAGAGSSSETTTEKTLDKMYDLDNDLNTAITILDSYIALMDSADSLIDATDEVTDELNTMMDTSEQMINTAESAADTASDTIDSTTSLVTATLKNVSTALDNANQQFTFYLELIPDASDLSEYMEKVNLVQQVTNQQATFRSAMMKESAGSETGYVPNDGAYQDVGLTTDTTLKIRDEVTATDKAYVALIADLKVLENASDLTTSDLDAVKKRVTADLTACSNAITKLADDYSSKVDPQLNNTIKSIGSSLNEVESLLNYSSDAVDDVADILGSYPNALNMGTDSLEESRDAVLDMQGMLEDLIADFEELEGNDQYQMLCKLIENDPALVADYISEPIELDQEAIYGVENNGSATAPFYVVLSIWFGALIIAVIVKSKVKPIKGVKHVKNYQTFFGRYVVTYLIGQLQTVITVFGCLFYVDIQCQHPFLFWLACSICSFVFTFFIYSMVYATGSVGEAATVIFLVVQVAGSGGTFPVEVLPKIYQYLYSYMPFAFGMNAIRETIGGMHNLDYVLYLSNLGWYVLAGLFLGLVVTVPYKKLGNIMEEALEKTGCMG